MPNERDDCIEDILKSIRDRRDRKFVQDHLDELDERASNDDTAGSYREALGRAAEEMLKEEMTRNAIRKRNVRMDALKFRDLRTFVDAAAAQVPNGYRMGIEARLVGVNRPIFDPKSRQGNQLSAGALGLGAQRDWIGGAVLDMQRLGTDDPKMQGLDKLFFSRKIEDAIFTERFELTRGDAGKPGKTKNPQALEIAKLLQKWDRVTATSPRHFTIRTGCARRRARTASCTRALPRPIARSGRPTRCNGSTPNARSAPRKMPTRSLPRCMAA